MYQGIYGFVNKFVELHRSACVCKRVNRRTDEPTDLIDKCINEFIDLLRNDSLCNESIDSSAF